jgi:hypothetical protein
MDLVVVSLLSRVAEQQLRRGASIVLDLVARDVIVAEWAALAANFGARFSVLECFCTDVEIHRARIEGRSRNIPGWYELTWERVERGRNLYPPLRANKLVLDSINLLANNVAEALAYVRRSIETLA